MATSPLPTRFPCWCQATYSWGGETKKDLGFIEGDLIEALNAGDGSWWMGRLRRDPRAVGLFPSNFVKVLDQGFQPAPNHRNASPLQPLSSRTSRGTSGTFRKPFQAYEKLGPRGSLEGSREATPESDRDKKKKEKSKFRPYSSMKTAQAPVSTLKKQASTSHTPAAYDDRPRIPDPLPRRSSKTPNARPESSSRQASPSPFVLDDRYTHSPAPLRTPQSSHALQHRDAVSTQRPHSMYYESPSRPAQNRSTHRSSSVHSFDHFSPLQSTEPEHEYGSSHDHSYHAKIDDTDASSPPPPPPPAHRVAYSVSRVPSYQADRPGSTTPMAPSPGSRMTPSPLRDAMNDVMNSLQDMSTYQPPAHSRTPSPMPDLRENGEVWSPDAFELVRSQSLAQQRVDSQPEFITNDHHAKSQESKYASAEHRPCNNSGSIQYTQNDWRESCDYERQPEQSSSFERSRYEPVDSVPWHDQPLQSPIKGSEFPQSSPSSSRAHHQEYEEPLLPTLPQSSMRLRRSIHELRQSNNSIHRMQSTKTNVTNSTATSSNTQSSVSTQLTSRSLMSGYSAGGFSATSAGSLARRKHSPNNGLMGIPRPGNQASRSMVDLTPRRAGIFDDELMSGPSYHESHASHTPPAATSHPDWSNEATESSGVLGGMIAPKARRSGFFRKMIDSAKSTARTGAATARSTLGQPNSSLPGSRAGSASPSKGMFSLAKDFTKSSGDNSSRPSSAHSNAARDMGLGGGSAGSDWMQVRRDVNRSNTLSRKERDERIERCELHDQSSLRPIELFHEIVEGDESLDGLPVTEPTIFNTSNLSLVDKNVRFMQNLPSMVSAPVLAQGYVCRPYRSDVQRLRAIFTWISENIHWEEEYESMLDTRQTIHNKRGSSEEIALLTQEMCSAVGLQAEIVRGYLKAPGESLSLDLIAHPNHWWNAVIADGEWRILDCALAGPTHPRRGAYSNTNGQIAESWYFLTRPVQICYTHIPLLPEQQHIVPCLPHEILMALPCATPAYFKNQLEISNFDTALLQLENLEMAHIHVSVPEDVECVAETESRAFANDIDGDRFESGDVIRKRVFAQAEWIDGRKRFTIKAVLPGEDGQGTLKIYSGKRGLMHTVRDIPHGLAFALPLSHTGQNPPYDFHIRHPTPHAQRHDLYVVQPQCAKLVINNTFVFCVRQHPSSLNRSSPEISGIAARGTGDRSASPNPFARPSSAMSMASELISVAGSSNYSDPSTSSGGNGGAAMSGQQKPAKLALQSPSQKIIRLTRKQEHAPSYVNKSHSVHSIVTDDGSGMTTSWETVVKIGERGTWRGLVLADRSARWCVFAEWECI